MNDSVVGMNDGAREDEGDQPKKMNNEGIDEVEEDEEKEIDEGDLDEDEEEIDDDDEEEEEEMDDDEEEESDDDDIICVNAAINIYGRQYPVENRMFELIAESLPDEVEFSSTAYLASNESAILLGRILVGNTRVTHLHLSLRFDLTSDAARALAEGISGSQIEHLTLLSSFELPLEMAQLGGAQALNKMELWIPLDDDFIVKLSESFTGNQVLNHLVIQVDGMITARGAKALAEFVMSSSSSDLSSSFLCLEFESVASNNLSTVLTIQTLYVETVQRCHNIQHFKVVGAVGDMLALATPLPGVAALTIEKADLSLSEVEILCNGLKGTSRLTSLNLVECGISDTHMSALTRVLGNHRSIQSLNFDKNQIGDAGMASFIEHWSQESVLSYLNLSDNKIGARGAYLLMKALPDHSTLAQLILNGNKAIGYDGIKMIGDCLVGTNLEELDIGGTVEWIDFDDAMCEAAVLQHAKHMKAGKALLEGVRGNVQLRLLRIHSLRLSSEIKREIREYILANGWGIRRRLQEQHNLPPAAWSYFLAQRCFRNTSLMFLFLRELPCLMMECGGDKEKEVVMLIV